MADVKSAVRELLEQPIKEYLPEKPILLVLDGLEEGTGDASTSSSSYDDQTLQDINLCWANPVLRFVCVHLRSLPKNVSVVVTSRSNEPGSGQDYLEHMLLSFGDHSLTVEAVDHFWGADEVAAAASGKVSGAAAAPAERPAGVIQQFSNRFRMSMTSSLKKSQAPAWSKSFPYMLYAQVSKEMAAAGGGEVPRNVPEAMKACVQLLVTTAPSPPPPTPPTLPLRCLDYLCIRASSLPAEPSSHPIADLEGLGLWMVHYQVVTTGAIPANYQ